MAKRAIRVFHCWWSIRLDEMGGLACRPGGRLRRGTSQLATLSTYEHADQLQPSGNIRWLSRVSFIASTIHSIAAFASFLVFLVNGRYRTLLDRILRLRLMPPSSQVSREVNFEYLNRQLVWHAFTEFLLFLLPLVGISRWKRWLSRAWRKTKALVKNDTGGEDEAAANGELAFLPERNCAICYQDQNLTSTSENEIMAISGASGGVVGSAKTDVTNPYQIIPCGCIYCFVCIAKRLEAEEGEGWICLRCGELVKECKPWAGDVLEQACSTSNKKTVSFSDEEGRQEIQEEPSQNQKTGYNEAELPPEHDRRSGRLDNPHGLVESQKWLREESDSGTDIRTNR